MDEQKEFEEAAIRMNEFHFNRVQQESAINHDYLEFTPINILSEQKSTIHIQSEMNESSSTHHHREIKTEKQYLAGAIKNRLQQLKGKCCRKNCMSNSSLRIADITNWRKEHINSKSEVEISNYLYHLVVSKNRMNNTVYKFEVFGERVCRKLFAAIAGISEKKLRGILNMRGERVATIHTFPVEGHIRDEIIRFLCTYFHNNASVHDGIIDLGSHVKWKSVFGRFQAQYGDTFCTYKYFTFVLKKYFSEAVKNQPSKNAFRYICVFSFFSLMWLNISQYNRQCGTCLTIHRKFEKGFASEEEKVKTIIEARDHQTLHMSERVFQQDVIHRAKEGRVACFRFDLAESFWMCKISTNHSVCFCDCMFKMNQE